MFRIRYSSKYRKSIKRVARSGKPDLIKVNLIINTLAKGQKLLPKHKDHELTGPLVDLRECHVRPNLLLIYYFENESKTLVLVNIGSHPELFG